MPARARVRCGPREQRERERDWGDELEHFYHKSQQLGSAHSIFSKTPGGAAAICKAACAQIEFATDSPLEEDGFEPLVPLTGYSGLFRKKRRRAQGPARSRRGRGPEGSTSAAWRSPAVRDQAKGRRAAGDSNLKLEAPDGTDSSQTPRWGKTHSNAPSRQQKQQLETDPLELGWKLGRPGCRLTLLPELPTPAVRRGRTTYADSVREQRRAEAVPTPIDGGRECGNQRARLALNGAPAHADL